MLTNKYPGLFIVLEGLDGSGLSTQSMEIRRRLRKLNLKSYQTQEPTDNIIGGLARGVLTGLLELEPEGLQLLFSTDRNHHTSSKIIPMLKSGGIVVCDRYFWSTVAFGSISVDKKWLLEINKHVLKPDLVVVLKVPPKECIKRMSKSRYDYELFEKLSKLKSVWKTYDWLHKNNKKNSVIIDGTDSIEKVTDNIITEILKIPKAKRMIKKKKQ
jgi:dTMP kinase